MNITERELREANAASIDAGGTTVACHVWTIRMYNDGPNVVTGPRTVHFTTRETS